MDLFGTRIKAFKAQELGTGTLTGKLGKCIVPSLVTTEPVTLVSKCSMMKVPTAIRTEGFTRCAAADTHV
jgi:hypothetical protein